VLLLLGGTAAKRIAGIQQITKWRGQATDVEMLMTKGDTSAVFDFVAVPTFHPSYLNRMGGSAKIKGQMLDDIKLAWRLANGK
jgi:uracil-DNA glycosylase